MTRKKHSFNDIFTQIVKEEINNVFYDTQILTEDKRTKQAMNRARQVIREHFNNASWLDDVFNHQDNPEGLTYLEYMLKQFIDEFYHNPQMRAGQTMRLMPLFCKLAFEFNFQNNNPDVAKLNRLRNILNHLFVLSQKGENLSKISLDMTFDDLNNVYGSVIDAEAQAEKERMANAEYVENKEYTVIGPVDFETAHKYGNESCPKSKLCYTQGKDTWGNYTAKGMNNAYIILKDGWENIPPQHEEGSDSPYDDYGLSMIFVFVDGEGDLVYCNTRWNHSATYPSPFSCDHAMNKEMISELIGRRFELVFKPNTIWQDKIAQIKERLSNGEDPRYLFSSVSTLNNGFVVVELNYKFNLLNTEGQFISDKWFDWVENFYEGYAVVELNGKYNYIDTNGQIISDKWFDVVENFYEGFARVRLNGKYNFINTECQIISDKWFDGVEKFYEGFARVKLDNKWNYINTECQIISDKWFNRCNNFYEGFAKVELNGKYNFINTKGEAIFNQWFNEIYEFNKGVAPVKLDNKWNFINTEGQFISNQWFDWVGDFYKGFARVELDNKWNYINTEGQIVFNQWFDWVGIFCEGFAKVRLNGKYNFINTEGQFISDKWFDRCNNFYEGFAKVELNGKCNYIDTNGKIYETIPIQENRKNKTIIISEKQIEQLKKVRQGIIAYEENKPDYEIGFEKPIDMSSYAHVIEENSMGFTTLYYGLNNYELLYALNNKKLIPNILDVSGVKELWLTNKPQNYPSVISFNIPNSEIGENKRFKTSNGKDYMTTTTINLEEFEYRIERCSGVDITEDKIEKWGKWYTSSNKNENHLLETVMDKFGELWEYVILPLIQKKGFINEGKIFKQILNEENRTQKKKCVENIVNNTPRWVRSMLDKPLLELDEGIQNYLRQMPTLFDSVANNQTGANKFIDYLRLNLYGQFSIGRKGPLVYYIPGISRIACADLNFYKFDMSVKGGDILLFGKFLRLVKFRTDFVFDGQPLDPDFNGMSYEDIMTKYQPKMVEHLKEMNTAIDDGEAELTSEGQYDIIPIPDYVSNSMLVPTSEGQQILRELGRYCDWCVCGRDGLSEYAQYLSNGGKMYVCLKRGYQDIERPEVPDESCPLDEYGLSMINVIIGSDGMPDNITTRWNHEYGGENHENLWFAAQLQKILNVRYRDVFTPRPVEDLKRLNLSESKILTENQNDKKANDYIKNVIGIKDFERIRKFIMEIYETIPYARLRKGYFLLGIVRMIHKDSSRFSGARMNSALRNIFQLYGDSYTTKLDRNFNGMSFDELMEKYYQVADVVETNGVKKIRQVANGYTIKHIETYDEMRETCDGEWCISYDDSVWYEFVEEDNCCVYVVENKEMINSVDEDSEEWEEANWKLSDPYDNSEFGTFGSGVAPYDTYGLSRFVVLVNPSYCMVYSRWNIPNCLDGEFLNGEQIQQLLGISFKEAFPYIAPIEYDEDDMFEGRMSVNEIIEPKDVDLSSFDLKKNLNPKFWKNEKLDSRIRLKLLELADDFVDSFKIENLEVDDIIMTGSLAGYTWNDKFSDIDIHILLDFKRFDKDTDFLKDYFKLKKDEWNEKHKDLKIYGFPVEVYVQDISEHHVSNSVYSLEENEWVTKPNRTKLMKDTFDKDTVQDKVAEYMNKIDDLSEKLENAKIETELNDIYNEACELFDEIKKIRNKSMEKKNANELSDGNIIFKTLRRNDYIEKLLNIKDNSYNKCNSLN